MDTQNRITLILILSFVLTTHSYSQDERHFKIFQFLPNMIPGIDGQTIDWNIIPEHYVVGINQLWDDSKKHPSTDTTNLNESMKVGWVKVNGCLNGCLNGCKL